MTDVKAIKCQAKNCLSERGNYVRLILCGILSIFVLFLPVCLSAYFSSFLFGNTENAEFYIDLLYVLCFGFLSVAGFVLVSLPAISAIRRVSFRLSQEADTEETISVPEKNYGQHFCLGVLMTLRPAAILLIFGIFQAMFSAMLAAGDEWKLLGWIFWLSVIPILAVAAFFFLVLTHSWFLVPFYAYSGKGIGEAIRESCRVMRGRRREYMQYLFSYVPLLLLSVATAGALYILYVLPLMQASYPLLARKWIQEADMAKR